MCSVQQSTRWRQWEDHLWLFETSVILSWEVTLMKTSKREGGAHYRDAVNIRVHRRVLNCNLCTTLIFCHFCHLYHIGECRLVLYRRLICTIRATVLLPWISYSIIDTQFDDAVSVKLIMHSLGFHYLGKILFSTILFANPLFEQSLLKRINQINETRLQHVFKTSILHWGTMRVDT